MPWPQANEFQDAVLNPQASFRDEELRDAEVVCDAKGLPIPASGQFGIVYQMKSPRGRWALKCFTSDVPGRHDRYRKISAHLEAARLPFMVGFEYLEEGVYIGGQWYPVLKMDWVEGQTLNKFVAQRLDKPAILKTLVDLWVKLSGQLRDAKITHADLQHGNIMLVPGKTEGRVALKLVDYDGMYVPALAGSRSGEVGHPNFQHPRRLAQALYGPEVDRFPNLAIHTALRALAVRGRSLWQAYDNGENLLFTQMDFARPNESKLLKQLWGDSNEEIRTLAGHVALATKSKLEDVPLLDELAAKPLTPLQVREVATILGVEAPRAAPPPVPSSPPPPSRPPSAPELKPTAAAPKATPGRPLPFRRLGDLDKALDHSLFHDNAGCFAPACGLALQGLKQTLLTTNLLPAEEGWLARLSKKLRRTPSETTAWGIDVGQCALKALRLELVDDKPVATGFDYLDHPDTTGLPWVDFDKVTRETIQKFIDRNELEGATICLGIPGQTGLARFAKLPPMDEKSLPEKARFEAKQQIPFPLEEVVWSYQKLGQTAIADTLLVDPEIALFAMKRDTVDQYLKPWKELKVDIHILQMMPLALVNFLAYDVLGNSPGTRAEERAECAALVDIGTDNTSLVITDGARVIWQRPVPLGGNHFTRALTKELKLVFAKAEQLKRNLAGDANPAPTLAALKPVFQDFVSEVQRSLSYFSATHRDRRIGFLLGVGGGFRLRGLQTFLANKLALQVHSLGPVS